MFYPIILVLLVAAYGIYSLPEVKGLVGEIAVKCALSFLSKDQYIIMHDIYIPAYDGLYTQIDHLIVASCGIIVIETKNYSGKLSGNSRKKYWMAYRDGEYHKVYNPVRQNSYHIKMLKENCPKIEEEKIYSIIC
ncbi:MAG: NERD domain-containing protein, partial [Clostridiales bacterium]|nr:NERD domain-containing protein [Clostridiales bacterium]